MGITVVAVGRWSEVRTEGLRPIPLHRIGADSTFATTFAAAFASAIAFLRETGC